MSEDKPLRIGIILSATVIMALIVWVVASALTAARSKPVERHAPSDEESPGLVTTLEGVTPRRELPRIYRELNVPSTRTLAQYYERRVFPGSPPYIPHEVTVKTDKQCLSCHENGGYVPSFSAYAPVTPHPTYLACRQCHVEQKVKTVFRENLWASVRPPVLGRPALPGGPPPIPHSLQLRENCLTCHFGPGSVREIKSPHPERSECTQCHVERKEVAPFTRPLLKLTKGGH